MHRYRTHPFRRVERPVPVVWRKGATRLLDYGRSGDLPVVVVPSMINRAWILDILPGRSLLDALSAARFRPLLVDWGEPGAAERRMTLEDAVLDRLREALMVAGTLDRRPPILLGYCMGGTLALGLACAGRASLAGLALLAAPFDFHAAGLDGHLFRRLVGEPAATLAGLTGALPVDHIQALFAGLEPLQVPRKFARFARLDSKSDAACLFVAVEDWLNDGVPLAAEIAHACLIDWYADNLPARGLWQLGGRAVRPEHLDLPVCLAVPARDRIVPPASSEPLIRALPRTPEVIRPAGGHIGMVIGGNGQRDLAGPLTGWMRKVAAMQDRRC